MPRIKDIDPATLDPQQRQVYDAIVASPRGRVDGPLRVWLSSPEFASRAHPLGAFCRFGSSLPARLSELGIIVVGAHWKAGFEFWAHGPLAIKGGLDPAIVEAVRTGAKPTFERADERVVYAVSTELVENKRMSDATYKAAVDMLGEKAVVELVGILGYYCLICMTINAFEVPLPPGEKDPFAPNA